MKADLPKVLHSVCGKPMLFHVLDAVNALGPGKIVVVVGHEKDRVTDYLADGIEVAVQEKLLGTGHAVLQAKKNLEGKCSDVLVLYGDTPLLRVSTLRRVVERHLAEKNACTLLTALFENPAGYGRIVRKPGGEIKGIVEDVECAEEERKIKEINSGVYCFRTEELFRALDRVKVCEKKGEYFLTDCVAILADLNLRVNTVTVEDNSEIFGVNSQEQLDRVEALMKSRAE